MSGPDIDDTHAVATLKAGDIGGLEFLVRAYQVRAVRAAYLVTRDRGLAEEVVQSAFLKAYERIGQFDAGRPFAPWFLRIVINDARKVATKRSRHVSLQRLLTGGEVPLAGLLIDSNPWPEETAARSETARTLWEALDQLPPNQRAAVVLRYYLGLKEPEIATRIGRARGTVKRLLHVARRQLRDLLSISEELPVTPERRVEGDER